MQFYADINVTCKLAV